MKKISNKKKIVLSIFTIFFLIISCISIYLYQLYSKVERVSVDRADVVDTGKEVPKEADDVITIALFGSDYSEYYDVSSADATMILSINTKNNTTNITSIKTDIKNIINKFVVKLIYLS